MASELSDTDAQATTTEAVARRAPTEQQDSAEGVPKRFSVGQTVCNEKNEKGKLCNGHLKQLSTQHPSEVFLRGDDTLHQCQTCGALYMGPPLGHVRDSRKQRRYVERGLAAILKAAGGTLPVYDYPVPDWRTDARPRSTPKVTAEGMALGATTEEEAAPVDSSSAADSHRPAAEAQAATGEASAAPLSPAAATASPAAGAETAADLAPEASTELTPGAPPADAKPAEATKPAEAKPKAKKAASHAGFKVPPELKEIPPGETHEEKIARLSRIVEEAKRAAGKL